MPTKTLLRYGCLVLWCGWTTVAVGQENPAKMKLASGKLELTAPANWVRKQPRTRIVQYEFAIPAAKGDPINGRLTVMAAGGGVEANIERWFGQFTQPDGSSTKKRGKVKTKQVAGQDVHLVDISGTFKDQRGPVAPAVQRPKYRMLAAIIETQSAGDYFVKFYGPEKTVAENEKAFFNMIDRLEQK
jgi:hypothetical protein